MPGPSRRHDHERPADPLGAFVVGPALLAEGRKGGPLSGTRFAVKDLFDVAGTRTGAGNPDWLAAAPVAGTHCPAVAALLSAGADLWGKTVTDELAFSLSGSNAHYGTPANPRAPGRLPGGSSSGSASAVAGGVVEFALGTDTGGSVRAPAAYCGIFGLRPTHGRLSTKGVVALAPSFDTVGILAANGRYLASAWQALVPAGPREGGRSGPSRRLVLATDLFEYADAPAAGALAEAASTLGKALGLSLQHRPLGAPGDLLGWLEAYRALQLAEAWQVHGRFITERRPRLGPGVASRFAAAAATNPEDAERAAPVRAAARAALSRLLGDDGVLVQPAAPGPAPLPDTAPEEKATLRERILTLTSPAGLAGAPVVVLPVAQAGGLPLGLALVGLPGDDEALVEVAEQVGELGLALW
jgi:amidase